MRLVEIDDLYIPVWAANSSYIVSFASAICILLDFLSAPSIVIKRLASKLLFAGYIRTLSSMVLLD